METEEFEIEQYRSLRSEILRAMEDGNQVMNFGLAGFGIVLSAGINIIGTLLGYVIFVAILPGISALVLSMWFAAHERVARASYFITGIETRLLARQASKPCIAWDTWLRGAGGKSNHFWGTEKSGIAIFILFTLFPIVTSVFAGQEALDLYIRIICTILSGLAFSLFLLQLAGRIRQWKIWLSTTFKENAEECEQK